MKRLCFVESMRYVRRYPQIIDAGHFISEEEPVEYASIVLDAITRS